MKQKKILVEKIDVTPTWSNILPYYIDRLKYGNIEQKKIAEKEILRLGKYADKVNKSQHSAPSSGAPA